MLELLLKFHISKKHVEKKSQCRWVYNYLPRQASYGFTLAEVLITLTVIGIIAALTIPTLLQTTQNQEFRSGWRKMYSVLDQATKRVMLDYAGSVKGVFTTHGIMQQLYIQKLNVVKECAFGQTFGNCWASNAKFLNGVPMSDLVPDTVGLVLNNGAFLMFVANDNCATASGNIYWCGSIDIDINGFKGPNIQGKDIYGVWILENTIKPTGTQSDWYYTNDPCQEGNTSGLNYGYSCSAKYLMQ